MNRETEIWNELNCIVLSDATTDAAVRACELGDTAELGRIIMAHVNTQLSESGSGYELTDLGKEAAEYSTESMLADVFPSMHGGVK